MRSTGIGRRSTLITSMIKWTLEVSTQASFRTARISQVKWSMTPLPHSDGCNRHSSHQGSEGACHPRASCNPNTNLLVHDDGVSQGLADGYISVIRHHRQEHTLSGAHGQREVHLSSTPWEWDGVLPWNKICHHWSLGRRSIPDVQTWQVAEEEAHGCVRWEYRTLTEIRIILPSKVIKYISRHSTNMVISTLG